MIDKCICEDELYVLRDSPTSLVIVFGVLNKASFELWHSHLGNIYFDVISSLHKLGVLNFTSVLPKPIICKPCQLSKEQILHF